MRLSWSSSSDTVFVRQKSLSDVSVYCKACRSEESLVGGVLTMLEVGRRFAGAHQHPEIMRRKKRSRRRAA